MKTIDEVLLDWEAVIGLEVHTELTTLQTKMFCSCAFDFGEAANSEVCPVCLGLPGALPVPNQAAIESIVLAGLATGCDIMPDTMFYRKHYFYPDMTKNYQITQGPLAFCMNGEIELEVSGKAAEQRIDQQGTMPLTSEPDQSTSQTEGYRTKIGITRIHMEEDAGKLIHIGGTDGRITGADYSLVDYNRCGTPLIELVTEPDLRTPEEARLFLQKLRLIYLTLGISNVSMEEGSLRCDGNISLRRRGDQQFGTKTELKNMNSFRNLHDGLEYEICRQAEVLENGGLVRQETRHWEPATKRTIAMRSKEAAEDYRYFPDPDLTPFHLTDEFIESIRARLAELPDDKNNRYVEKLGLPLVDAANLAGDPQLSSFFEAAFATLSDNLANESAVSELARPIANLLLNDVSAWLNQTGTALADALFTPSGIAALVSLGQDGTLSSRQLKDVFAEMATSGKSPTEIVEEQGLRQVSDSAAIEGFITKAMAANPDKVAEYQAGKTGLLGFFVGQVMREMQGQGNPRLISEMLSKRLDEN
ncbi:MAG: Asp-tRNA(Asn)/Glu-tRNA(Gln) amidotransferase subunit GatB [Coriobacteriales bacterium]|jgi:aspartyl-tRNA(Asn)/glutamyl-tRNA(Gln) amidotransferase subunit B|nr:Asp-tRNA(Asn)/Glu-tRNA(Gln) amidotransferase subunit GatB [Coriobacteriales bacterium]